MSVDLGTAVGYLDLDTSKFKKGFKSALDDLQTFSDKTTKTNDKVLALGSAMTTVGSSLTKYVTTPLVGIGTAAFTIGNQFESAMSKVQAISGAAVDELEALTDQAMELGATTAFSASEAAAGMENLASAGFNVEEIMDAMPGLLNLAASSGAELGTAAEIAASAVRGFGLEASETAHVADVFAEAAARTNAQTEDMGEAMKYIAPVAHAMGISLEETAAAIGILSDAGIKGSQAGTSLRGALSRLAKPTKAAADAIQKYGLSFYTTEGNMLSLSGIVEQLEQGMAGLTQEQRNQALITIFGQEALSGILTLMDRSSGSLEGLATEFETVSGSAQEMADIMMDNTAGAIEEMLGALETAAINIQQVLAPIVTNVVRWITDLINSFNQLPDSAQKMIVTGLGLTAAFGPFLLILGKIVSSAGNLMMAFKGAKGVFGVAKAALTAFTGGFAPVLGMIAAVIAAVVALKLAWDNDFGDIREKTAEIGNALQVTLSQIIAGLQWFGRLLLDLWNKDWLGIQTIATTLWSRLEIAFGTFLDSLVSVFKVFSSLFTGDWKGVWNNLVNIFTGVLKSLGLFLASILDALISILVNIGPRLWSAATTVFNKIREGFSEAWGRLREWFEAAKEDPVKAIKSIGPSLKEAGSNIIDDLFAGLKSAWEKVESWIKGIAEWIADKLKVSADVTVNTNSGSIPPDGSFASGLDYVPRDMIVKVHEGESIRTKQQTSEDRKGSPNGDTFNFYSPKPISEVEAARQFKRVKRELAEGF